MKPLWWSVRGPHRRGLTAGLILLGLLTVAALGAPWLAPLPPDQQLDPAAARLLGPGSSRWVLMVDQREIAAEQIEVHPDEIRYLRLGRWQSTPRSQITATPIQPVLRTFWLGTDRYGRDVLSRILFGARVSLRIGFLTVALSLLLGITVGSLAGLLGGWTDRLLMRSADALFAFPQLFLILAAAAVWHTGEFAVILILGATSWVETSRLTRAEIQHLKTADHFAAAKTIGMSPWQLITRHLMPLALPPVLIHATLRVGDIILTEAALSFLGFGVQPPTASWGNLIAEATDVLDRAWWLVAFPGLCLCVTVLALGLIGDGLTDELDPKRRS